MPPASQCFESADLPTRGGAAALACRQPVLRGNSQVIFYCHQAGGFLELNVEHEWRAVWFIFILFFIFSRLPLYQALFTSFRQCLIERQVPVLLPGVMMKGQAQVQVTLYQHVCVHLCASVAAIPPVCFSILVSSTHFQSSFFKLSLNDFFLLISISTCRLKSPPGFRDLFPVFLLSYHWQEPCFLHVYVQQVASLLFWLSDHFFLMVLFLFPCDQQQTALERKCSLSLFLFLLWCQTWLDTVSSCGLVFSCFWLFLCWCYFCS